MSTNPKKIKQYQKIKQDDSQIINTKLESLENEVLTYLGVNNLGTSEKKEHLITAEVNSNNELISQSGENFLSMMEDFCERIKKVLDIDISVKIKAKDEEMIDLDLEEDEKEEENDE